MESIGVDRETDNTDNLVANRLFTAIRQLIKGHWQRGVEGHKPSELTLMICIAKRDHSANKGLKISEISRFLGFSPPTITQLINSLEAKNMVERHPDPSDRRVVRVKLTDQGRELTRKAKNHRDAALNRLVEHLGEAESQQLTELLFKVHTFLKDNPPPDMDRLQMNGDEKL